MVLWGKEMRKGVVRLLLAEGDAEAAQIVRRTLSQEAKRGFQLTRCARLVDAETRLAQGGIHVLLLSLGAGVDDGLEKVRHARAAAPEVPIVIVTDNYNQALMAAVLREGAQDYLTKDQLRSPRLAGQLTHVIERFTMQLELNTIWTRQMRHKDEFLSHVSHELRSPLTSLYSFGTIIADGLAGPTSPQQDEYLQIMLRNVRQLQAMIEDLLTVTQVHEGKLTVELQRVSVFEAILDATDTLRGAAAAKEIIVLLGDSHDLPPAYGDPTRIRQILIILIDNAVKFSPRRSVVSVDADFHEGEPGYLILYVSDSGCGIEPAMADVIFDQLYQINDPGQAGRKGLGLGLYIARELVTRQGGRIWVESDPQKGSQFSFIVPIAATDSFTANA
jgi:signal transduction histidine kinase